MKAYSYVRWSSAKQTQGDSLRRQTELAKEYAKRHGLTLDETSRVDPGMSAFTGKNAIEGELGSFLRNIDEGKIETPCYLLVEALDRITRAQIDDALSFFLSIIKRGVTIVTLQNEQKFSSETIKSDNGIGLIIAITMLVAGHEDSKKRGQRVKAAWDNKREQQKTGVIASAKGPSWLKLSPKREWQVIERKAEIVRKIFALALDGWGSMRIASHLNEQNVPTLSHAEFWTHGNVGALLKQPAVHGEWRQTHGDAVNPNYYPAVISKETFDAVQSGRIGRRGKGGAHQEASNLFAGMTYCAYCGGRTRYSVSGAKSNRTPYLRCLNATSKGGCTASGMPYSLMEVSILHRLINVQKRSLNPVRIEREQEGRIAALEEKLTTLNQNIEKLVELSLTLPNVSAVTTRLQRAQDEADACKAELNQARGAPISVEELEAHEDLFRDLLRTKDEKLREQVRVAIRRQLAKIEIAPHMDEIAFELINVEKLTKNGKYEWSENPIHAAILTYAGGSVRAVECTHVSSMA